MIPNPLTSLQGDGAANPGIPGFPGMPGIPGTPFGLPPPVTSSVGLLQLLGNQTGLGNISALYQTLANMTAVELLGAAQSVLVASLVRQYMFNDFFAGGLGLMLIGALGALVQRMWTRLLEWLNQPKGTFQVRVAENTEMFHWLQDWLLQYSTTITNTFHAGYTWDRDDGSKDGDSEDSTNDVPRAKLRPELKEAHGFEFKGETVWVQKASQMESGGGGGGDGSLVNILKGMKAKDDLVLSCCSKDVLEAVVQAAIDTHYKKQEEEKLTGMYRWSCDEQYWVHLGSRKARPLSSVILACDPGALLKDAKKFLNSESWYADRGIPHRRGYLLHGPPGCGKTSLIKALAGELELDVAMISLSSNDLNDDLLQMAMNRIPDHSIFVLEDVDAAFGRDGKEGPSREGSDTEGGARVAFARNNLSFSGLLNAIDGIMAQEGNIVVMTTNHLEKLDPALIRPGRIDLRLHIGLATPEQARGIFRRFYPDAAAAEETLLAAAVPPGVISPASLQGLFLEHRDDLPGMLARLPQFVEDAQSKASKAGKADAPELAGKQKKEKKSKRSRSKDRRREVSDDLGEEMRQAEGVDGEEGGDEAEESKGNGLAGSNLGGVEREDVAIEDRKSTSDDQETEGWETVGRTQKKTSKR